MNDTQIKQGSGSYTANLLGNIRSHLAGLQGYDVMALDSWFAIAVSLPIVAICISRAPFWPTAIINVIITE